MSTPAATIRITLDKRDAERDAQDLRSTLAKTFSPESIQGLSSSVSAFGKQASSVWGTVKSAYEGAEAVLQRIVSIYNSEAVAGAVEEEQANLRLATALRLRGEAGAEIASQRAEEAEAIERVLGLAAGEIVSLDSQLVLLGVQTERLTEARAATLGLAEVTGKDLHAAARDVAAVLRGDTTRAIKQLGLDGMEAEAVIASLAGNMAIAEERAESFGGRIERMNANIDDMMEPLGEAITKSATWSGGLDTLRLSALGVKEVLGDLADTLVDNFITGAAGDALDYLASPLRLRGFETEAAARDQMAREERDRSRAEEDRIKAQQAAGGGFIGQLNARVFGGLNFDEQGLTVSGKSDIQKREDAAREAAAKAAAAEEDRRWKASLKDRTDMFVGPIDPDQEQFRKAEAAREMMLEMEKIHQATLTDIEQSASNQRFQVLLDDFDKREEAKKKQAAKEQAIGMEIAQGSAAMLTSLSASLGAAAATGQDAGDVIVGILGGVVASIGGSLIGLGTSAVAAGLLGTAAPWLLPVTGGPAGVAAGLAAIAVGTALTAGGAYIQASVSGGGAVSAGRAGGGPPPSARTLADQPQTAGARGGDHSSTFIVQVTGGIWGMDSGRALRDLLDADDRRRPVRRGAS